MSSLLNCLRCGVLLLGLSAIPATAQERRAPTLLVGGTVATIGSTALTYSGTTPSLSGVTFLGLLDFQGSGFNIKVRTNNASTALTSDLFLNLDIGNALHTVRFGTTANTITFPNTASYTVIGSADTGTVTNGMLSTYAHTQSSVAAPTGTTNTTGDGVMMGLAGTITPTASGNVRISVCGSIANSTVADGANVHLRTGTGTAPSNGGALTGTTRGSLLQYTAAVGGVKTPFCATYTVTGLSGGVAAWIDVSLSATTAGTATITNVDIVADEIP